MSRSHEPPYMDPLPALGRVERHALIDDAYDAYAQLFTAIRIARAGSSPNATSLGGVSGTTTGTVMMCTTTTITGTIEEVAELYTARDSHYVIDFAESKRLYELEAPSNETPLRCVGVRYSRWASISNLVTDRDLVYLEVMDEFVDKKTGHRGWARCTKSIEHRSCPPSQAANGPLRAELFVMGMVVRETGQLGVLELITLVHADVKKHIPSWIVRTVLKARKKNAQALSHILKVKRRVREGGSSGGGSAIGDFTGRSHSSEEEPKDPRVCKGCMDRVSRWTRSYKCRSCYELICKSCATMMYVDTDTQELRNRICAECSFAGSEDDNNSFDFELVDSPEYLWNDMGSARSRDRSATSTSTREKKEKKQKPRKHSRRHDKNLGEGRERTYSQLSVEEKPNIQTASPSEQLVVEDLSSTMRRLQQLNDEKISSDRTRKQPSRDRTVSPKKRTTSNSRERVPSNRERTKSSREPKDGNHERNDRGMEPPTLFRNHSAGQRTTSNSRMRGLDRKHSHSPDNVRMPRHTQDPHGSDPKPRPAPQSEATSSANAANARARGHTVHTSTVATAKTPMIDLSYLQSFAVAKPSVVKTPAAAH